jgi:predicted AAA+ superfamily ATPase
MLKTINGSAFTPVPKMSAKLSVAPVKMIPQFKNFLLANVVPALNSLSTDGIMLQIIIETNKATIGPPITVLLNNADCKSVDFVAKKSGGIVEYYQVALNVLGTDILERELAPLEAIEDNYPKYVISGDIPDFSRKGIKHINIIKFLLNQY